MKRPQSGTLVQAYTHINFSVFINLGQLGPLNLTQHMLPRLCKETLTQMFIFKTVDQGSRIWNSHKGSVWDRDSLGWVRRILYTLCIPALLYFWKGILILWGFFLWLKARNLCKWPVMILLRIYNIFLEILKWGFCWSSDRRNDTVGVVLTGNLAASVHKQDTDADSERHGRDTTAPWY